MYDCIIVGGGIAGMQAAIQLGRYASHKVLVVDASIGRSSLCRSYHNVLGWPDGISGEELRRLGRMQAGRLGVEFAEDKVIEAEKTLDGFRLKGLNGAEYSARTLLLATGVMDRFPEVPGLVPCLGMTVYVCPDCDGFEVRGKRTVVLGSGEAGAHMALTLWPQTQQLVYVNHEKKPVDPVLLDRLRVKGISYYEDAIGSVVVKDDGRFEGVVLHTGETIEGERGFIAFGGNEVRTDLAKQLGVERMENRHVITDSRTQKTNVPGVWCAGDIGVHAEQLTIAMGEGSTAAIWMHKELMKTQ
jgi:thioredoxin reductase (NADPH)